MGLKPMVAHFNLTLNLFARGVCALRSRGELRQKSMIIFQIAAVITICGIGNKLTSHLNCIRLFSSKHGAGLPQAECPRPAGWGVSK